MANLFVLFKSKIEGGEVKNQVVGQVKGESKAAHVVSKFFAKEGLVEQKVEIDSLGITKIGTSIPSEETFDAPVAFSSFQKNGI